MTTQQSYIQAVRLFNSWLESEGLRKTQERFAVLKAAWGLSGHFGAQSVISELEHTGYHVSRGTVYNTLTLLEQCGVLSRHHLGAPGQEALYEKALGSHLHLICSRCGKVVEHTDRCLMQALRRSAAESGYLPTRCVTYIYGLCPDCAGQHSS